MPIANSRIHKPAIDKRIEGAVYISADCLPNSCIHIRDKQSGRVFQVCNPTSICVARGKQAYGAWVIPYSAQNRKIYPNGIRVKTNGKGEGPEFSNGYYIPTELGIQNSLTPAKKGC